MIEINHKDPNKLGDIVSRLDSEGELTRELSEEDAKIVSYIRHGIDGHEGISLSQELCLHRKKLIGLVEEDEWNDYCQFVQKCIDKARE